MATITLRSVKGSPLTNNEVDTNFTNLNNDKYESGDAIAASTLSASSHLTVSGETTLSIDSSVTAAGTDQSGATALTNTFNVVNTATANQGVKLPDATTGKIVTVLNDTSVNVKLYPASSESIDALSSNIAKDLQAGHSLRLVAVSGSKWNSLQPVLIYDSSGNRVN